MSGANTGSAGIQQDSKPVKLIKSVKKIKAGKPIKK